MTGFISLSVSDIKKKLGKNQALDNLSLSLEGGKMHGLIGPEGAGKTTLMRIIIGLLKPDKGHVEFTQNNKSLSHEQIQAMIAYMPQQQSLYPDLSIEEHLEFFRRLYLIGNEEFITRKKELLHVIRLEPFVKRLASQLSGGMYKKLGLMCALLRSPEILLLDEPTNGVDPISRREFWDLLYRLLDRKILIIVATSYMDEAERCSYVHLINEGKLIIEGEPRELLLREGVEGFDELFLKHNKLSLKKEQNG